MHSDQQKQRCTLDKGHERERHDFRRREKAVVSKTPDNTHTDAQKYLINQIVVHVLPAVLGARDAAVAVKHAEKAAFDAVRHARVPIERRVGNNLCKK